MKLLIIGLLFIIIPFVRADIISFNSAGSEEIVLISNELIEGFFFGIPEEVVVLGGGGGGSIFGDPSGTDGVLCNYTYNYVLTNKDYSNTSNLDDIIRNVRFIENKTYTEAQVKRYIDNWQLFCSNLLKKSLKEDFVCSEANKFLKNNSYYVLGDIIRLSDSLKPSLTISPFLLEHYLNNYDSICPKLDLKKIGISSLFIIILFFLLFLLIFQNRNKKKVILMSKIKPKSINMSKSYKMFT